MSAGTIALTNKSAGVTGTGTSFTADLKPNDFIVFTVGQTTYTLAVKAVLSDTSLTLVRVFDGPASMATAWTALPAAALVLITSEIVTQTTDALRAQNYDRYNWEQVYTNSNNITVTLSDGSTFSGPSWKKISDLLADLDIDNISMIADEIHADAEQVAADKETSTAAASSAATAATDAQTAASNAATANTAAQQAKTDAVASATTATAQADRAKAEADRAAAANPDNSLLKVNNLSDLTDKPQARTNLDVYSKSEVYSKGEVDSDVLQLANSIEQVNTRIDTLIQYQLLYPNGSAAAPATIGVNTRLVVTNPYPGKRVIAVVETLVNSIWGPPGFTYVSSNGAYGVSASQINETGDIVIQSANTGVSANAVWTGNPQGATAVLTTVQYRLKLYCLA